MIGEVESLRTELEASGLTDGELLEQSNIPILKSGLVDLVANALLQIESARGRRRKDRLAVRVRGGEILVGAVAARRELSQDLRRAVPHPVLARIAATEAANLPDAGVIVAAADATWRPRLELRSTANLPASQKLAGEVVVGAEKRQRVDIVDHYDVTRVELRGPPQVARVVAVGNDVAVIRAAIHALRQGVGETEARAAGEPPIPGDL